MQIATIAVGPLVRKRGQKFMAEITVRRMHFQDFKTGRERSLGGFTPARLHVADIAYAEFVPHQPAGVHCNRARRDDAPGLLSARAVGVVDRTIAMPGPLHGSLAAGMSKLNGRYCAIGLDELRYAFQWRNVRVRPDAQIAVGNAA